MIRVHTRYGSGKWAQTTAVTLSVLGPVLNLAAHKDDKIQNRVHLSWDAPSGSWSIKVKEMKTSNPFTARVNFGDLKCGSDFLKSGQNPNMRSFN